VAIREPGLVPVTVAYSHLMLIKNSVLVVRRTEALVSPEANSGALTLLSCIALRSIGERWHRMFIH